MCDEVPFQWGDQRSPLYALLLTKRHATPPLFSLMNARNIEKLKQFITEQGKIIPQKHTGLTTKQQREIKRHIKQARILGLLPFVLAK